MTLTTKQITQVAIDYRDAAFPHWRMLATEGMLLRTERCVAQGICFDRASDKVYRPMGFIRVLVAPKHVGVMELPQEIRHPKGGQRSVHIREHEKEMPDIIREIRHQVKPSIENPLDPEEVLNLYEREARTRERLAEAYSLAALTAYLGQEKRCKCWTKRYNDLLKERYAAYAQPIDYERQQFLNRLESWIRRGIVRERLDTVMESQKRQMNLS